MGPVPSPGRAGLTLAIATAGVAWMSELLVGAVHEAAQAIGVSEVFIGVIVVAVVGNAAEHSTAVLVAMKNRMDLSLAIAIGSSLQIALFAAPVLVLASFFIGPRPMDLVFTPAEVIAVILAVLITAQVASDGESNWLEGALLTIFYVILASESLDPHEQFIRGGGVDLMADPSQAAGFRELLDLPLLPYVRAVRERAMLARKVRDVFRAFDVLVAPTTLTEAIPADADVWAYRGKRRGGNAHLGALVGTPELSVPMGFGASGLPIGLSFIGDRFTEGRLLGLGIAYQRDTDWHLRTPPVDTAHGRD